MTSTRAVTIALALSLGAATALAGPRMKVDEAVSTELDGERPLAAALASAGWVATPEGSDRYQPGHIYDARNALQGERDDCFEASPTDSIYNELEVAMALKAGARVPLGLVSGEASGARYKKLTYADPRVSELSGMNLQLTEACTAYLSGKDTRDWYVVQAVLLAIVNEQECWEVDASVKVGVAGAGVEASEQCSVASEGQVAVAYKTVPVSELLGSSAPAVIQPSGPASTVVAPGGFRGGGLDVSAEVCAQDAMAKATAQQAARLDEPALALLAEATRAWAGLAPGAEQCLALDDRSKCVAQVQEFIDWAAALQVEAKDGFETVQTDCGAKSVPVAAAARSVSAPELAKARAALAKLEDTRASGQDYAVLGLGGDGTADPIILGALDKALIDEVVKRHMNQIKYCYQRELITYPSLAGKIVIKFVIAKDGSVSSASTKTTTMNKAAVENCVAGWFLRMQFPQPKDGGIVIVSYPFVFGG